MFPSAQIKMRLMSPSSSPATSPTMSNSSSPTPPAVNYNKITGIPCVAAASRYTAPVHIDVGGTIYTSSLETLTKIYTMSKKSFSTTRIKKLQEQNAKFRTILGAVIHVTNQNTSGLNYLKQETSFLKELIAVLDHEKCEIEKESALGYDKNAYLTVAPQVNSMHLKIMKIEKESIGLRKKLLDVLDKTKSETEKINKLKKEYAKLKKFVFKTQKAKLTDNIDQIGDNNLKMDLEVKVTDIEKITNMICQKKGGEIKHVFKELEMLREELEKDYYAILEDTTICDIPNANMVIELEAERVELLKAIRNTLVASNNRIKQNYELLKHNFNEDVSEERLQVPQPTARPDWSHPARLLDYAVENKDFNIAIEAKDQLKQAIVNLEEMIDGDGGNKMELIKMFNKNNFEASTDDITKSHSVASVFYNYSNLSFQSTDLSEGETSFVSIINKGRKIHSFEKILVVASLMHKADPESFNHNMKILLRELKRRNISFDEIINSAKAKPQETEEEYSQCTIL